ncbi:MAG: HAD-IA family hydrolase [Nannocystaceae bacterium]|nr:HAD-IA family hydrolase [Nannocystaceae bacterium]
MAAVLFDLDGTLVDSLGDIAASTNVCLAAAGFPTHSQDVIRGFVGNGIGALVERALGPHATPVRIESVLAAIRGHYQRHSTDRTRPFPGITKLLQTLTERGLSLGVVSNKPHEMTVHIVRDLFPGVPFDFVTGESSDIPRKPDPTGLLTACAALGVSPRAAVYVGDTGVDIEAARAANVRSIAVTWGFRDRAALESARPDHWATEPGDILAAL